MSVEISDQQSPGQAAVSSRLPRTLLLTSSRPGVGSVGELFLGSLCKLFAPGELYCFAAVSTAYDVPIADEELGWLPLTAMKLPAEYGWQYKENILGRLRRRYGHIQLLEEALAPFVDEACKIVEANQIELLWLVLNSPSALLIAEKVLERTGLPSTAIVWDPISHITEQGKMDKKSQAVLEERSKKVVSQLRSCGVASAAMQHLFAEQRPELPTRVLINTPKAIETKYVKDPKKLVITFSGSLYARNEFLALIAALNQIGWALDERAIELQIFSTAFDLPVHSNGARTNLVFGGYLPESQLLIELAKSDVAYMPYWFGKEYAEGVKRCFPAKLATYVAGGCPVLYHGPKDASPTIFLAKYEVGKSVHKSDPTALEKALRFLTLDEEFKQNFDRHRQEALSQELGNDLFKKRFLELVEIAAPRS